MNTNNQLKHLGSYPSPRICGPNSGCCRTMIPSQWKPRSIINILQSASGHMWLSYPSILNTNGHFTVCLSSSQMASSPAQSSPTGSLQQLSGQNMLTASTFSTRLGYKLSYYIIPLTHQYCRLQLPEHLKNYHKTWSVNRNEENLIKQHKAAYNDIRTLMTAPMSMPLILVAPSLTLDQEIDTTWCITSTHEVTGISICCWAITWQNNLQCNSTMVNDLHHL